MKKHRVSTTISGKHWELLKKYTEKLETQQKVLELALESLKNNSRQTPHYHLKRNCGYAHLGR